jgi:hypothetical protein
VDFTSDKLLLLYNRIRATIRNFSTTSDELIFKEETTCLELAKKASELNEKLKKCLQVRYCNCIVCTKRLVIICYYCSRVLQGKEVRAGTSLERLRRILNEAEELNVNFEHELRIIRLATTATEFWLTENAAVLSSLGIVDDGNVTNVVSISDSSTVQLEKEHTVSINQLEQLILSASQLSTSFPELVSLKQKLVDANTWVTKVSALRERATTFVRLLSLTKPEFLSLQPLMATLHNEINRRKHMDLKIESVAAESVGPLQVGLTSEEIDKLISQAKSINMEIENELLFLSKVCLI